MVLGAGGEVSVVIRAIDKFSTTFTLAGNRVTKFAQRNKAALLGAGAALTAFGVVAVMGFGKFIKSASDAQEVASKFNVVFRTVEEDANRFTKTLVEDFGRSTIAAQSMLSAFQDTFIPLGFGRKEAAALSGSLAQLAVDVGSFNNVAAETVASNFISAIVGNHEAVRKYGIIITEATLKQKAYEMGIGKIVSAEGTFKGTLTDTQKVMVRQQLIFDSTADAQGDFSRTSGEAANQQVILKGKLQDLSVELGTVLLPMFTRAVSKLSEVVGWFSKLDAKTKKTIIIVAGLTAGLALLGGPILILIALLPALSAGFTMLWGSLAPVMPIILAVAGAVAGLIFLYRALTKESRELKKAHDLYIEDMAKTKTAAEAQVIAEARVEAALIAQQNALKEASKEYDIFTGAANRAASAQENFARVVGGRVYVGVDAVKAALERNLASQGILTNVRRAGESTATKISGAESGELINISKPISSSGSNKTVIVNIENVNGIDSDAIASDLQRTLHSMIS